MPLKAWVDVVPFIFYDEMNGYDFDLYFVGTMNDFSEVQKAFLHAGVSDEQVRLFHKIIRGSVSQELPAFINAETMESAQEIRNTIGYHKI